MSDALKKRLFDLLVGVPLVVLTLPLVAVGAVASALSLRAWPFFTQRRVGLGGREFTVLKIRSLPVATPGYADKYAIQHVETTRVGRALRATHLDELPQLWLVLTGAMSLVGPRPEMQALAARFAPGFAEARALVRPGCTGLWQVSEAVGGLIREAPQYDLFYLRHWSVRLDGWIVWRTLLGALPGERLISLDDVPRWALGTGVSGLERSPAPPIPSPPTPPVPAPVPSRLAPSPVLEETARRIGA
ncbi:MAG: sugar transferase [Acidimicrobiales bacterium]|nr:sugar transferase [Acidimicrobiales bacterium]